ncbi:MAG: tRNA (adenosine(37)-N6)-threonylcarbamoyltransferase complex transferase subunit TsaD [bacterium]|nr:tRNA (adenosine(37)-N6)-threonylcarbamoyltransferase complex transferase subunit TsaD [bacterium]
MKKQPLVVLGIETSCDETAAAIYHQQDGILSNTLFSQIELHKKFGGVVPELASRSHLEKINPIIKTSLEQARMTIDDINVIAVTNKPGLPGSLFVGVCFAKALAWATHKQIIGINHLEGHAFSSFLEHTVPFEHLCITASGGHTSLYLVHDFGNYTIIGQTQDDAAGEAFDKIAKLLGLPYPGGPVIERLAHSIGFQDFFNYPRSKRKTLDFSFSGLKTAVLYDLVNKGAYDLQHKQLLTDNEALKKQVASSLLVCIADIFEEKITYALEQHPTVKALTFVGGVACNKYISGRLRAFCEGKGLPFFTPSPQYCSDNAAMIALVGCYKAQKNEFSDFDLDILT